MEKELTRFRFEEDIDSDDSMVLKNESRKRQKPLYKKSPKKFISKDYTRWENWVKHFKAVANANGWIDSHKNAAMPTCLTSWSIEEFETVPKRYIEKEPGSHPPRFDEFLEILKRKMQQYCSQRAKAAKQWENEDLRDYSRRVR